MTVAASAHAGLEIMMAKERLPIPVGELGALIAVDQHLVLWLPSPVGHQYGQVTKK